MSLLLTGAGGSGGSSSPALKSLTLDVISATEIDLSWSLASSPPAMANNITVFYSTDGVSFTALTQTVSVTGTSYSATGLTPATKYYFYVQYNTGSGSSYAVVSGTASNTANATTSGGVTAAIYLEQGASVLLEQGADLLLEQGA